MDQSGADNSGPGGLRQLPSVDHLLKQPVIATLLDEHPRSEVLHAIRAVLEDRRQAIRAGQAAAIDSPSLALDIRQKLYQRARSSLRRVINATGVVLHTGLGRAPLAQEAVNAIADVAAGYCNLELDVETGRRGERQDHLRGLLRELTGAEDGVVVNNNAAGTYLVLNTLAAGREVVVSRGQLVEIGGSYRMPDIMAAAGCKMVEVGTTNRTRLEDYQRAITADTSVVLRVHTSNYRVEGFVESVPLQALVEMAREYAALRLVVVDDLGSGLIARDLPWSEGAVASAGGAMAAETNMSSIAEGAWDAVRAVSGADQSGGSSIACWDEPTVRESVAHGADLTLFSGDKLLGGPQAGIVVGRADLIARLQRNPLMRTFRPDKLTLAGLEATLRLYRDPQSIVRRLPVFRMLASLPQQLKATAEQLREQIARVLPDAKVSSAPETSYAGGGALPTLPFPTWVVRVSHPTLRSADIAAALRRRDVPLICRMHENSLLFDCRTLSNDDADQLPAALVEAVRELSEG